MTIKDQLSTVLTFSRKPKRIVSLVPSQTELLCDLGLRNELLGITKFCVHPIYISNSAAIIGGTKNINIQKLKDLNPDIVIANKEENTKESVQKIREFCPVYVSDVNTIPSALEMVLDLGEIFGVQDKANEIAHQIRENFSDLEKFRLNNVSTLYFIWKKPYMVAGTDTFINEMLHCCGFQNCLEQWAEKGLRYPAISVEEIISLDPQLILLSSEPFPFKEEHKRELEKLLPRSRVEIVDGEYFSWYGSRLIKAPAYFKKLIG